MADRWRNDERPDRVVVWFRRDLRLTDHPALAAATSSSSEVHPLFVLDERLLDGPTGAPARTWFLKRSLAALDDALRSRDSRLLVRVGPPESVVPQVARRLDASVVLASRDVTPFSHRRDQAVSHALEAEGRRLILHPGLLLVEPERLMSSSGATYKVFSPFWRALLRAPRRRSDLAPEHIVTPRLEPDPEEVPIADLRRATAPMAGLPEPGESAALRRLEDWVAQGLATYAEDRDRLDGAATSHLGQDLHLGLLSPLQVESAALASAHDAMPFVRQIAWREFYHHLIFESRADVDRVADSPFLSVVRSEEEDPEAVTAWREGRTGIPVVDAGMRQLAATAWLSNRARMVVASFLTRHLLMDYRIGERHFLRHLIDGDVANNLGGWQWTAAVGADPQPWFRIFNPVLQGQRFDRDGDWVRRWVPELAGVPARYVHSPWEMPETVAMEAGVILGTTYPWPIVDLREGRERALSVLRSVADIR